MKIKVSGLTAKQAARFQRVQEAFPQFEFWLHRETDRGMGDVWGVTVNTATSDNLGYVSKPSSKNGLKDWQDAHTTCDEAQVAEVRKVLNAASAALWHKQPMWQ